MEMRHLIEQEPEDDGSFEAPDLQRRIWWAH